MTLLCTECKNTRASFGLPDDKKATYCGSCKKEGMINIVSPKCISEWCYTRPINKYEGYCAYCYVNLYPDKPNSRNYKTKETAVACFVKERFSDITISTDKTVIGGCSRRRPDIFIDLGFQLIIVEIDENQHRDYDCSCENKRLMELSTDVNHRNIIFIRFNPDDYLIHCKKISSPWEINSKGLCSLKNISKKSGKKG